MDVSAERIENAIVGRPQALRRLPSAREQRLRHAVNINNVVLLGGMHLDDRRIPCCPLCEFDCIHYRSQRFELHLAIARQLHS